MQPWVCDALVDLYESLTTANILVKIISIIEYFSQKQRLAKAKTLHKKQRIF